MKSLPSVSTVYRTHEDAAREQMAQQLRAEVLSLQNLLQEDSRNPALYSKLAKLYEQLKQPKLAIAALEKGISCCAPDRKLYRQAVAALAERNRTPRAIEVARLAAEQFPHDGQFRLRESLALPVLYDDPEQIGRWRERYASGLAELAGELRIETLEDRRAALDAISDFVNFYLAYQARNDRALQEQYGQYVHRIMGANYPAWTEPVRMPPLVAGGRIRVGYVSTNFHYHSTSLVSLGWLRECDRQHFELFAYYPKNRLDWITDEFRLACDHFRHCPGDLESVCQAIRSDRLHVLVFIDIGIDARMTQLGALRLAPIQCATWAHPITTGLPTVDYFLSSDLMEPPDAQDHYSERLIRLPGIGTCRQKPVVFRPLADQPRSKFGLRDDATVFLCCQTSFKYLPQHDHVLVEIAKRVPASQFVFLAYDELVGGDLEARVRRAFAAAGLEPNEHCKFLPELPTRVDYWNLSLVADVFLDSLDYSGFTSTMEAVACGLPIVTLPGKFARGRQTYAILTQLGVSDTIARDKADYVDIAVRLGRDREWRTDLVRRMADGHRLLFWDKRSVRALEEFYRRVVTEAAP